MVRSRTAHNKIVEAAKWYHLIGIDYTAIIPANTQVAKVTNDLEPDDQGKSENLQEDQSSYFFSKSTANHKIIAARQIADRVTSIEQLKDELLNFELCDLKHGAQNLVFADGNPNAKVMLIGEAPGAHEDEQGIPFCGISGQLLTNMLSVIGLWREKNFYITNTIFWRPPNNRQPLAEEIEICRPFVEKHIALVKPEIIVLIGSVALNSLLGNHYQISSCRGNLQKYSNPYIQNINTTAIFHPAYLIRQPLKKKTAWFDMIKLRKILVNQHIL